MKKRLFSLMLALLLVVSVFPLASFANDPDINLGIGDQYTMSFVVDTVTVDNDDETVTLSIKTQANGGFAGINYQLNYDSSVFSLESDPVIGDIEGLTLVASGPLGTGKHLAMITSGNGENVIGDGTLVTYTFAVKQNALAGTYEFKLITDGVADLPGGGTVKLEVLDENRTKVSNSVTDGAVTIPGYSVKYDANGGSGAPEGVVKSKNIDVTISHVAPTREGFNFLGWDTNMVATNPRYKGGDKYSENADVVFYAVWEKKPETVGLVKMEAETVEGKTGGEVEVKINLTENPAIHAMVFDVVYDENVLEFVSVEKGLYGNICVEHATKLSYQYLDLYNYGNSMTETGTLLTLKFKVKEDAPDGFTAVTIVPSYEEFLKLVGGGAETGYLDVEVTNGGVEVKSGMIGDLNEDGRVNQQDRTILARHLSGWDGYEADTFDYDAADVNEDGRVNQQDRTILARHLSDWDGYETLPYKA